MNHALTGDEIVQRVSEMRAGILRDRFAASVDFCDNLFGEQVIHDLPVGFAYYNDQFVLQRCNRTYADYVRMYTPFEIEKALGMSHFDYKPGAAPFMEGWFLYIRNSGEPDTRYDLELHVNVNQKERISFWDSHLEPIHDSGGRLLGFLMCCIDRTDRNIMVHANEVGENIHNALLWKYQELRTTLRVLMRTHEEDRRMTESRFVSIIQKRILPELERLKQSQMSKSQLAIIRLIEKHFDTIFSSFCLSLSSEYLGLTPTEIRVAGLVESGLTSKEIAMSLGVSKECVDFHRNSIRKKLGLTGRKVNLRTHLSCIS